MCKKHPKVSVIVITYNHAKYIRQCIDSILMQITDFEYEILIGDDASSDGTQTILKEYHSKHSNIKIFLNKENQGANQNAYRLIKIANGEYLANCDGDDYWTSPNKLQSQVEFLEKNKDYVGCTHKFTIVDENNIATRKQYLNWVKQKSVFTLSDFKGIYLPGQPSTFLRRNLVREGLVDLEEVMKIHPMIGDRTAMMLFLMNGDFGLIEKNMSCYRRSNKKSSITDCLYGKSFSAVLTDYKITTGLESLANKNGIEIDFKELKIQLFLKALFIFFYTMDNRVWVITKKYFSELSCKELFLMPVYLAKRIFLEL